VIQGKAKASGNYLRELGLLTICWASLEAYIDLIIAYLAHEIDQERVPRPFNQRLKFIRRKVWHPALVTLRIEMFDFLDQAVLLARKRNDLTHGITVAWKTGDVSEIYSLREFEGRYVALLDGEISYNEVSELNKEIDSVACRLFGLLERIKAIFRFLEFDDRFIWLCRLDGDRG
jgi:membrane-associated protease RseP (regulator of RpoE activity)